jgi:hypothetical protein
MFVSDLRQVGGFLHQIRTSDQTVNDTTMKQYISGIIVCIRKVELCVHVQNKETQSL